MTAMKPFRFRLQTVLDYRTNELNRVRQWMAVEAQKCQDLRDAIEQLQDYIQQTFQDYNRLIEQGDPWVAFQGFSQYIQGLKGQQKVKALALIHQEKRLAEVQQKLQIAMIRQKSLEKLKEKAYKQYQASMEKEEEKFLSEVALQRFQRQGAARL